MYTESTVEREKVFLFREVGRLDLATPQLPTFLIFELFSDHSSPLFSWSELDQLFDLIQIQHFQLNSTNFVKLIKIILLKRFTILSSDYSLIYLLK